MKTNIFLIALLFSMVLCAQEIGIERTIKMSYKIDENSSIYNKETLEKIDFIDFPRLIKDNPNSIIVVKEEDQDGSPVSYYFIKDRNIYENSFKPKTNLIINRKDILGKSFKLEELDSKLTLVILQLNLELPMINVDGIKEAEDVALKRNYPSVILTSSSLNQSKLFSKEHGLKSIIIPNALNLMKKIETKRYPLFLILNNQKAVIFKTKYYDELESELLKFE